MPGRPPVTIATFLGGSSALLSEPRRPIGRPFQPTSELELIPDLVAAALKLARRASRIVVVPELRGPYGVADVAVLETTDEVLSARLALGIPPLLNQLDAAIVGAIHAHRSTDIAALARELGWMERHLTLNVASLIRRGVITRRRTGALVKPPALVPMGRLSVYEAKVDNWRRGFDQTSTYATWADRATLALRRLPRDSAPVVDAAARLQVGLIADGVWKHHPGVQPLSRQTRFWASEHVLAALL